RSRPGWTPSTSLRKPLSPIRSTMKTVTYVPGTFVTLVPGPYIQANLSGFDLALVAGVERFYDSTIFARPGITRLEQLKGKRLGISGYGAATHFAALIVAKHLNLDPNKEMTLVPGGPDAERVAALSAGKIDASVFNSSTVPVAKRMGFIELVYLPDLGVEVQGNGLATTRAYIKSNRDTVKSALKGYV